MKNSLSRTILLNLMNIPFKIHTSIHGMMVVHLAAAQCMVAMDMAVTIMLMTQFASGIYQPDLMEKEMKPSLKT